MRVYTVWYIDYADGMVLRGIYSTKEKAQNYIKEELKDEYNGEPFFTLDSFHIETEIVE